MRRSIPLIGSTIGFVVLFAAAALSLGTTPDANDTGTQVARWFRENGSHVRWSLWFLTLSLMLFAVFAALVRNRLPGPHRDVFFFGAVALVAETAVQGWLLAGVAWHSDALAPATARTVLDVASYWGPVLTSATVLMLAPIALLALREEAGLPRWLALVAGVALGEQIIETITIFGRQGFIAPGGPMNLQLGAILTTVAIACTGVVLALPDLRRTKSPVAP
jgi:apolipoprotein N-acyltransferase